MIRRFDINLTKQEFFYEMTEHDTPDGDYCAAEDVDELEAENAALHSANGAMKESVDRLSLNLNVEFKRAEELFVENASLLVENGTLSAQIAALESEVDFQAKIIRDRIADHISQAESDHDNSADAATRVNQLNGGSALIEIETDSKLLRERVAVLEAENATLKREIERLTNAGIDCAQGETMANEAVAELEKENERLRLEVDAAEKAQGFCYACANELTEMAQRLDLCDADQRRTSGEGDVVTVEELL